MASCTHCTRTLPEDAQTCPFCGTKVRSAGVQQPKEDLLYRIRQNLRKEQKWWKWYGLILVVAGIVALAWGAWSFLRGDLIPLIVCAVIVLLCIPAIIVNFLQYGRVEDDIEGIYIDCSPALERADDRGRAILSLCFNPVVFSILVKSKAFIRKNRDALEAIRKKQDQRYESTFRNDRFHSVN